MTLEQIARLLPHSPVPLLRQFLDALTCAMGRFAINTPQRQAAFIAQAIHESNGFARMTENLDYAADALVRIWPSRFTADTAHLYGRTTAHAANQQMIANVAYANRMGNGSIESGDGWRYRGRGPGQLTGRDNYRLCGAALGVDLVQFPEQVALPTLGCAAFAWFWKSHGLNELADIGLIDHISGIINGGDLGLQARRDLTTDALAILTEGVPA